MFLNQIEETNKEDFLKVCVHASLSNGVFAEEEKETLFAYCRELNVKEHIPETPESFEKLIKKISAETNMKEKRIFILEILALVKSDGVYDEIEQGFMKTLSEGLGLQYDTVEMFDELLSKYVEIGKELFAAIVE